MKCDNCKKQVGEMASIDNPYVSIYCAAGHWDCPDMDDETEDNIWDDCKDFEVIS